MNFEDFRRRVWEENERSYTTNDVLTKLSGTWLNVYGENGSRYRRCPLDESLVIEFRINPGLSYLLGSTHWEPVGTLNPDTKNRFFWDEDLLVEFANSAIPIVPDLTDIIKQGTKVIHSGTGGEYTISCFGFYTANANFLVVYKDDKQSWIRPVREFFNKFTFKV